MTKVGAGQAVIDLLVEEGVSHIFGIVGSSFLDILDATYEREDIGFIGVRHEQAAALMADGFSRISGKPAVCLVTNGPGVLNLTYGVASAYVAHSPVVVLAPSASREHQYRESTQEFDQVSLFRPITKASFPVNKIERLPDAIRHAFRVATSDKMGPVLVDIPRDLMPGAFLESDPRPVETYRSGPTRLRGDASLILQAAQLLSVAQRPVVIAGGGVVWSTASSEVLRVADEIGAPVIATYGHSDVVSNDYHGFLGHLGRLGSPEGIEAVRRADVILAVGTRLGQSTTFFDNRYIPATAKIIQVDIDAQTIGRHYPLAVGIPGDAQAVLEDLLTRLDRDDGDREPWRRQIAAWHQARANRLEAESALQGSPMKPQRAYAEIRKSMPPNAIVALDAGLAPNIGQDRLTFARPRSLLMSLELGGLGFSFPASLGAGFAAPARPVLNINGDGGFLFNAQEFETAVRYGLNHVTIIMNNGSWGSEKAYQKYAFGERYVGADTTNPRFDKYAELFGGRGFYVDKPEDVADAVRDAMDGRIPSIIEIPIDPDELPRPARLSEVESPRH